MPVDFAVRLEYGVCVTDVLDTFNGLFERQWGADARITSIPLTLSVKTLREVHEAVMDAQFFSYPAKFEVVRSTALARPMRYRLRVRSDGIDFGPFFAIKLHTRELTQKVPPAPASRDVINFAE